MLECERIDISKESEIKKTNLSKECDICHYWYFRYIGFTSEPYLYNNCHGKCKKL